MFIVSKAKTLQEIDLKILSSETCQNMSDEYARFSEEKEDFYAEGIFCAGGESGKDVCSGDSGSAIFMKENDTVVQMGLVSGRSGRGVLCGDTVTPSLYTRISFYLKWILDNISE